MSLPGSWAQELALQAHPLAALTRASTRAPLVQPPVCEPVKGAEEASSTHKNSTAEETKLG